MGGWVMACEILLSSPGTGGTLYSIPRSQVPGPESQVPSPSPSRLTIVIRACEKNNFEMVFAFVQYGYKLESNKETIENLRGSSNWTFPLLRRAFKKTDGLVDILVQLRIYQALTKPVYMIAKYKQKIDCETVHEDPGLEDDYGDLNEEDMKKIDPVTQSFVNVRDSR